MFRRQRARRKRCTGHSFGHAIAGTRSGRDEVERVEQDGVGR
jgi:hypothetical protein